RKEARREEIERNGRSIEGTLATFGLQARVIGVSSGPAVAQYALQPAAGVQVRRVVSLQNDLSLALAAAPLRIEAPIPGKSAIGIEVPNKAATLVTIREVVESNGFKNGGRLPRVAPGHDVAGWPASGPPAPPAPPHAPPADRWGHRAGEERLCQHADLQLADSGHPRPAAHGDDRPQAGRAAGLQRPATSGGTRPR